MSNETKRTEEWLDEISIEIELDRVRPRLHEGWAFERDLESQGHSGAFRHSGLEANAALLPDDLPRAGGFRPTCSGALLSDDEHICLEVCELLADHPLLDAGAVEVEVHLGVVTLRGAVATRLEHRLSVDVAAEVPGVEAVVNELVVLGD